jgi:predicted nuclease of restriction endonuclease-like RecB superfamily
VRVDDPELLGLADQMLTACRATPPPTRGELEETVTPLLRGCRDLKTANGLRKILLDRCEFRQPDRWDYPGVRQALFKESGSRLAAVRDVSLEQYRTGILSAAALPDGWLEEGVYADLPENEPLAKAPAFGARQLLERYNVGLVQALLLRAEALSVVVRSPDAAAMRRLLKYVRFFRLLARLYMLTEDAGAVRLEIDGPASVLAQPRAYGLQLASFFPAVVALERWELDTHVTWRTVRRRLRLTQRSGLVCHYRSFGAYVPEEIRLFHRHFRETVTDWSIVGNAPFLTLQGQEVVFPDLSFESAGGLLVHLELFHRWHRGQLVERLRQWAERPEMALIVGVDRALTRDAEAAAALAACGRFEQEGFLFRDYPTVKRTLACLERFAERQG